MNVDSNLQEVNLKGVMSCSVIEVGPHFADGEAAFHVPASSHVGFSVN